MYDEAAMMRRYQGALLGLAVGDALGTTLEFKSPGTFEPITDMVGGGPFNLKAGQWTDDTSMALCLAESLMMASGFNPLIDMTLYVRWYREGYNSSTGRCFDIGNTVRESLHRFENTGQPFAGSREEFSAGNGSLMRIAPIPMWYRKDIHAAWEYGAESSRTTHGAKACTDACGFFSVLIAKALSGSSKDGMIESATSYALHRRQLDKAFRAVVKGSYMEKQPPEIRGTGYVVESLEAALWAFWNSDNFRDGALMAVNLGDDADTTGAIYGQLAGAYYGIDGIPKGWLKKLHDRDRIDATALRLYANSQYSNGASDD